MTLRPYETVSEDDTIQFGAIPVDPSDVGEDLEELIKSWAPPEWVRYDDVAHRIGLPLDIAGRSHRCSGTHSRRGGAPDP